MNVAVDLPTENHSSVVTDDTDLQTVLNNLQTTAFHLLGNIRITAAVILLVVNVQPPMRHGHVVGHVCSCHVLTV